MRISIRNENTREWIQTGEITDPVEYEDILRVLEKPSMFGNENYTIVPEKYQAKFLLNGLEWSSEDVSLDEARMALLEFGEEYMYGHAVSRFIVDMATGEIIEDIED